MSSKAGNALTAKQQAFVDHYDGDIKGAAKLAGLNYTYCRELLTKHDKVIAAIQARESTRSNGRIATREERQEFWSTIMRDKDTGADVVHRDRLKASELLGRSEKDFTDRIEVEGDALAIALVKVKGV